MKDYMQPVIKVTLIMTPAILAGSDTILHNEKGDGSQMSKDSFFNFIGSENEE